MTDKSATDQDAVSPDLSSKNVFYSKAQERRLVAKLDAIILPCAMLLYLAAYLDRGNLGNARLQGLERDILDGDDGKYSIALSCFFITYVILSIPGTLCAKKLNPDVSIAAGCFVWSVASSSVAGAHSPAGLYVSRLFIGIGEAFFGPGMVYYLSIFYKRTELSKRVGLFITSGALAGAFGGLIAYGVSHINHPAISTWRILFLIEGLPGVILAIFVILALPRRPDITRYLTAEQRQIAVTRLAVDGLGETRHRLDWKAVQRAGTNWQLYSACLMYAAVNLALGSIAGFLPTIIAGLGYTNAEAQLYTVPPYAVAVAFMLLMTSFSDHYQTRGIPIAAVFAVALSGWSILLGINARTGNLHGRYFGCICVVVGGFSAIPIINTWVAHNCATESQRAFSLGALNAIGQCLAIAAAFLFPTVEGPQYVRGIGVNIGFSILGISVALLMTGYYRAENRRRDGREGVRLPKETPLEVVPLYDRSVGFRYVV